jgi:hypothetical protein
MTRTVSGIRGAVVLLALAVIVTLAMPGAAFAALNPAPPVTPVKLIFVHHSTGGAWLGDGNGNLGIALRDEGYFVSDTNYGWGTDVIGDSTDIGHWWTWFRGPSAGTYTAELYAESGQNTSYSRLTADPGGANEIVMFKSCFPNSAVGGSASDPTPAIGSNPLRGASGPLTLANAKGVYLDLLNYFAAHPDKLFVLIVSPPLRHDDTTAADAANARILADWLVDPGGWLAGYTGHNVAAYDYYTVLTGGYHRVWNGAIEHTAGTSNYLYPAWETGDSHPSAAGHQAATSQFPHWLNVTYNAWKAGEDVPPPADVVPLATSITIRTSATSARIGSRPVLSGSVTPTAMIGRVIVVYVKKPGKRYWTYSSNRGVFSSGSAGGWSYKYYFKRGMAKGVYTFKACVLAQPGFLGSDSPTTVSIRLK